MWYDIRSTRLSDFFERKGESAVPFQIVRNDITKMQTDAVVNAANTRLLRGSGVCGAIFAAADALALQKACAAIGGCKTGDAVLTESYGLPAKYVIHAVGPIWRDGKNGEEQLLYSAYTCALSLAKAHALKSISFPLLSAGAYGCPKETALRVAISAIGDFLLHNEMDVYLVVFDKAAVQLSNQLFFSIQEYIDDHYLADYPYLRRQHLCNSFDETTALLEGEAEDFSAMLLETDACKTAYSFRNIPAPCAPPQNLNDALSSLDESFSESLLRLIDEKGLTDVETYKKANIDRKLFSKIRSDRLYKPKKQTAIAFAVALELDLQETEAFLRKAGFALSHSNKFDVIIEFFILQKNYNIYEINEALFAFDQPLLGV